MCVYDAEPAPRAYADIIAAPAAPTGRAKAKPPVATGKWLTASVVDDPAQVIGAGLDEAEPRDPGHVRPWVALVDGNNHQIETITTEATRRNIKVDIVIRGREVIIRRDPSEHGVPPGRTRPACP